MQAGDQLFTWKSSGVKRVAGVSWVKYEEICDCKQISRTLLALQGRETRNEAFGLVCESGRADETYNELINVSRSV